MKEVREKAPNREGSFRDLPNGKIRYRVMQDGITYEVFAATKPECRSKMMLKMAKKSVAKWEKENPTLQGWLTEWHDKYIKNKDDIAEATKSEYWKHLKTMQSQI